MMGEPRETNPARGTPHTPGGAERPGINVKWVIIVILLVIGIDGFLTRLLEGLWASLRDSNSPAYLPLEWWMAAPFTLFVFAVLSALLTSFSGAKSWFKMLLLLCGCKLAFTVVTAVFFYFRPYPNVTEAVSQAALLSLPSVLVHILLSGMIVLFLKDVFVGQLRKEEPAYAVLPGEEERTAFAVKKETSEGPDYWAEPETVFSPGEPVAFEEEREAQPAPAAPARGTPHRPGGAQRPGAPEAAPIAKREEEWALLPVKEVVRLFPKDDLGMSPSEIEEISSTVRIPLEEIVPQLSEGRVDVEALTVISALPAEAFARPAEEVAGAFPDGLIELPLREVVSRMPPGTLDLPEQEMQPDVDAEFADFFHETGEPGERKKTAPEATPPMAEEKPGKPAPPERVAEPAAPVSEEALALSEEERLLFERSRHIVEVSSETVISQFPEGAMTPRETTETAAGPKTIVIPLELIEPQLADGEVKLHAKFVFPQFPEGCLSIPESEVVGALPNGKIEIPLSEIVPQLPQEVLAPPEGQMQQPALDEMPDAFREEGAPPALACPAREAKPEQVGGEGPTPPEEPLPAEAEPAGVAVQEKKQPPQGIVSYADMLREENPLDLPVSTVARLLPEGAFGVSIEELRKHIGGDAVKVPRSMVMRQLKEGRVMVPVEILTVQFLPEHFAMSVEQIKARFAEGVVELPLPELVGQVLEEVGQPPTGQKPQPECDEIPAPFEEVASEVPVLPLGRAGVVSETTVEDEESSDAASGAQAVTFNRAHAPDEGAERSPAVGVTAQKKALPVGAGETILRTLLQKCKGLGISGHLWYAAGESSALVLAASSLDREALVAATLGLVSRARAFCKDYRLGEPFKTVVSASSGAVVSGELVRGNPNRVVILASLDRSGVGTISVLLDKFETELREIPSLISPDVKMTEIPGRCAPPDRDTRERAGTHEKNLEAKQMPLKRNGFSEELCLQIVDSLREVGIERALSAATPSGEKVVAVWGEDSHVDNLLGGGIIDIGSVLQYAPDVGVGEFQSLLLVTERASITLNRSLADPSAYLLCFFPKSPGEGLVRAKAAKAAKLLKP